MTAQETNLLNAFETTLTGTIGASDLTFTVNSVVDSASNTLAAPCYLILNPDSATNREVVQVTSINAGTKTLTLDNINKRYLTGSAATSGLSHASGSVVRMSPVQQHIEDINDRVDTIINEAGTAVNTSLFLDEDDMTSNSATKGVTQQSVKAYVDTQLTAEDLDISADSGSNIAIDLDSEVLDLEGGTGIDTTTGTNKVTFAIDSTVATLTGSQTLTNKGINLANNTLTSTLAQLNTAVSDATLVDLDDSQTLTNKAIDSDNNTITNIVNANIKSTAEIDASKIADGSVSSTEFQYLDGVTSSIQTQINTALATSDVAAASIGTTDNSNGYIRFTNDFVIQWLRKSTTGNHTITYPLAMDNFYGVYVAPEHTGSGHIRVHSISATQITLGNAEANIQGWALITGRKT